MHGHTPLPWELTKHSKGWMVLGALEEAPHQGFAVEGLNMPRQQLLGFFYGSDEESASNARLFMIAPQLLDLAEKLYAGLEMGLVALPDDLANELREMMSSHVKIDSSTDRGC